jgi:hypothetical protein
LRDLPFDGSTINRPHPRVSDMRTLFPNPYTSFYYRRINSYIANGK